ncbi:MAG: metal ABC transporter substrate-binding protein [Thermoanaerobaculia bacterium]
MTRRTLPPVLLLALLAAFGGPGRAEAKLRVVSTLEDFAALATAIGGERVDALSLAKGYQDPHFVDAKPSFILQLSRADLLIVAGLELEIGYLPPMLDQSRNEKIRPGSRGYLDASEGCEILGRPSQPVTRAMGDVHPYGNPHYWIDPENGRQIARSIAARLTELDPAGRSDYATNLAAFEIRLNEKEKVWTSRMAPFKGLRIVTFHDSWPNFARRFELVVAAQIEPKPGIPPSPTHTLEVIQQIEAEKIPVILVEPYFDRKTPDFIAAKSGAVVVPFYPSVGGLPEIRDYFSLFDHNVEAFVTAMKGRG